MLLFSDSNSVLGLVGIWQSEVSVERSIFADVVACQLISLKWKLKQGAANKMCIVPYGTKNDQLNAVVKGLSRALKTHLQKEGLYHAAHLTFFLRQCACCNVSFNELNRCHIKVSTKMILTIIIVIIIIISYIILFFSLGSDSSVGEQDKKRGQIAQLFVFWLSQLKKKQIAMI